MLTVDDEYSHQNRENLTLPIQIQLSKRSKKSSYHFNVVLESTINVEHLAKKYEIHSLSISEIIDSKRCDYLNA